MNFRASQNPYRLHDQGYYNQRISMNIMNKAVQLYNDVVAARNVDRSIKQLKDLISAGKSISLTDFSALNALNTPRSQERIDISIREINALKTKLNIRA